jgi:hypothetical protein
VLEPRRSAVRLAVGAVPDRVRGCQLLGGQARELSHSPDAVADHRVAAGDHGAVGGRSFILGTCDTTGQANHGEEE